MKYEKKIRFIAATLFLLFSTLTVIYAVNAHSGFKATKESIERVKNEEGVEVSLLRFKARDGTPLKALYYIDSNLKVREDHSVPLIVLCHGMSSDYFMFGSFAYTMAKEHGFAVVSIEARGHGSNPAPSTLGYKEGKDIVDLLDYLDKDVKAINTSKSGVFGHSMGGLYAMNGYIEESLGKGRLKGLVEGSGPLNITREAYFLTNNPFVVGENSLLDNLAQKNPVNRANQTFPQNMILWHGTEDGTVDYQCVIDFLNVIDSEKLENPEDPQAGRSDVEFYSIEGAPHNLPDNFTKFAIMHFNNLLLGENLTLDEVQEYSNPIRFKPAKNAYGHVLYAAIFMMVVVPSAVLAVRPRYFRGWGYWNRKKKQLMEKADQDQNNGGLPEQSRDEEGLAVNGEGKSRGSVQDRTEDNLNCDGKVQKRAKIFLLYFGTMLIAGLSSFITDTYVATELIYKGIFSAVLFGILYGKYGEKWNLHFRKKKEIQFITKKSINLDNAVLMAIPLLFIFNAYLAFVNSNDLENQVMAVGKRNSWWFFVIWVYIVVDIMVVTFLARSMKRKPFGNDVKSMLGESLYAFILGAGGVFFYLLPLVGQSHLIIPAWFDFNIDVVLAMVILFGALFLAVNVVVQITERLFRTIVPMIVGASILVPFFVSLTGIIYFY